jgi:hypothetical protein
MFTHVSCFTRLFDGTLWADPFLACSKSTTRLLTLTFTGVVSSYLFAYWLQTFRLAVKSMSLMKLTCTSFHANHEAIRIVLVIRDPWVLLTY